MWKKTMLQLVKEFWIPALGAAGWTSYVTWATPSVEDVIKNFSTSFFLIAWATSQFFRVRKQAGVESSFRALEIRLKELVGELEDKTKELTNHMTGGNSFCYMSLMRDESNWIVIHQGAYNLQNLSARICDLDIDSNRPDWLITANTNVNIGTLIASTCTQCLLMPVKGNARSFNIFYTAANGIFTQELRLKRVNGHWSMATRVSRAARDSEESIVFERIDPNYPLGPDGAPDY